MSRSFILSSVAAATLVSAAIAPAEASTVGTGGAGASLYCVAAEPGPYIFPAPNWRPFFRRVKHYGPVYRYCGATPDHQAVVSVKY